jgi:hypothetical protein
MRVVAPNCASHSGYVNFEDERSLYFTGVIAVTGLSDLFGSFVERIGKDATKRVDV